LIIFINYPYHHITSDILENSHLRILTPLSRH